jgi:drug/metabolite transporter (DMT)-like permease
MPTVQSAVDPCSTEAAAERRKGLILGPLLMCGSALSITLVAGLIKWASHGFSTEFILAMRYGVSLLIVLAMQPKVFRENLAACLRPSLLMLQGVFYVLGTFCFYLSVRYVPLVDAILLFNSSTLFAPLFSLLFFKKKERPLVWLGIAAGMAGVALVLKPGTAGFQAAGFLALAAGALIGLQLSLASKLVEQEGNQRITLAVQFYGVVLAGVATFVSGIGVADWQQMLFPRPEWAGAWLEFPTLTAAAMAAGGLSMAISMFAASAYKFGGVGQVTPFMYTSIIFSGLIGWAIWGTVPSLMTLWGLVLIVAGGICALFGGQDLQTKYICRI